MRRFSNSRGSGRGRRALAEIVGTLMLVLIVVAAAISFSLFVASEQRTVQSDQSANHLRNLESLKIIALSLNLSSNSPANRSITLEIASLDINNMTISGIDVKGDPASAYFIVLPHGVLSLRCFTLVSNTTCPSLTIGGFSQLLITIRFSQFYVPGFSVKATDEIQVDVFTVRGNEFIESFVPPVAIIEVAYVGNWPLLDGINSYQPSGGTGVNASINQWSWHVVDNSSASHNDSNVSGVGQEVELPTPFTHADTYLLTLVVTNTYGLNGTSTERYVAP